VGILLRPSHSSTSQSIITTIFTYVRYDTVIIYIILRTKSILQNLSYVQSYTLTYIHLSYRKKMQQHVWCRNFVFLFFVSTIYRYFVPISRQHDIGRWHKTVTMVIIIIIMMMTNVYHTCLAHVYIYIHAKVSPISILHKSEAKNNNN